MLGVTLRLKKQWGTVHAEQWGGVRAELTKALVIGLLGGIGMMCVPKAAVASDAQIEAARKHMEQGQEAFQMKKFEAAAKHFEDAFNASPFAAFLYNAGLAMEKAEQYATAVEFYERYLKEEPNAPDADEVKEKMAALKEAVPDETDEAEGDTPPPPKPAVKITENEMKSLISIRTNPKNATIRIISQKGKEVSTSTGPLAQTVNSGTYTIEASHPDYKTVSTDIFVSPGQVYVVVVEMSQGAFLGFLRVISDPPGAAVYIDDKRLGEVGKTPFSSVLPAELHKVWVEKPGYMPVKKEIRIDVSEEVEFNAPMERPSYGVLLVKTNVEGALVFVDEKKAGTAGLKRPLRKPLNVGKHQIRVQGDGLKDYQTSVEITAGQERTVLVRLNSKPSRVAGFVSAGFGVAVFAAGGVFGSLALKNKKALDKERKAGRLASDDERILKGFLWGVGADTSFVVGTVLAGMSLYYFLRDPLPPSEGKTKAPVDYPLEKDNQSTDAAKTAPASKKSAVNQWMVSPVLGPETAGLAVGFAF